MSLRYEAVDPPPKPWAEKLAAKPMPPAVVPEAGHEVKEKHIAGFVAQAQTASRTLEAFYADASRLSRERFTLDELAARGGIAGVLRELNVARLNEPRKIVAELRKAIGYHGQVALDWGPGGFVPEYHTVESLAERVNACEAYAASLERAWSGKP